MTGRRTIVGICLLCAFAFSAIAAQGAMAASNGTTAFTCKKPTAKEISEGRVAGEKFSKEHCKEADTNSAGEYRHVSFAEETTTSITGGNDPTVGEERQVQVMQSTQAGIALELQAKIVEKDPETSAWMKNRKDPTTGEHYIEGEGNLTYTEVTVTKPALGCKVFGKKVGETHSTEGSVTTNRLKATTKGQGDAIKFEPVTPTTFAVFYVTNCSKPELNGPYEVTGTLVAEVDGATIKTTEANITTQNTLKLRGQKAGLGGTLTIRGYDEAQGQLPSEDIALSATTVATP